MQTESLSKHEKYRTKKPISQYLIQNFFKTISEFYNATGATSIIDAGCGEGLVLKSLETKVSQLDCHAIDLSETEVMDAKRNIPFCKVQQGSVYELPFEDNAADLVICSEVLEHLTDPAKALAEIHRVTRKHAILTVPNEPLWRILNMLRGKYWSDWGNTPDHRNHWSARGFRNFASQKFRILDTAQPIPWSFLLCEKA